MVMPDEVVGLLLLLSWKVVVHEMVALEALVTADVVVLDGREGKIQHLDRVELSRCKARAGTYGCIVSGLNVR